MAVADEGFLSKDDLVWIAHSINLQEMEAHAQHTFTTTIVKHHKDNDNMIHMMMETTPGANN